MMTAPATRTRPQAWQCTHLPLWARVWAYADYNHGRALERGELRRTLQAEPNQLSKAIAHAVKVGALREGSSAKLLLSTTPRI